VSLCATDNDFWNVLCGYAYRMGGSAEWKLVSGSTKKELEDLQDGEEDRVKGKYKARIEKATKKVAKVRTATHSHIRCHHHTRLPPHAHDCRHPCTPLLYARAAARLSRSRCRRTWRTQRRRRAR
jgi:hypothetical protein